MQRVAQHSRPGLVQRFLFSFGTYGKTVPVAWYGFTEAVAAPIIQALFELALVTLGPATAPRQFTTSKEQNAVVHDLEDSVRTIQQKQPSCDP